MGVKKSTEDTPLSAKQEAFVRFYLECFNGTQAAIKAGYARASAQRTATKLLKVINVIKKIQEAQDELAANLGMSRQIQMDKLDAIYKRRKPQAADRMKLKIIELQNKMLGFDTPKLQDEKDKFKIVEIPVPMEAYNGVREIEV